MMKEEKEERILSPVVPYASLHPGEVMGFSDSPKDPTERPSGQPTIPGVSVMMVAGASRGQASREPPLVSSSKTSAVVVSQ